MVEDRAEGQVLLKGGGQASNLGRFGEKWSSVVVGIPKWVGVGFCWCSAVDSGELGWF